MLHIFAAERKERRKTVESFSNFSSSVFLERKTKLRIFSRELIFLWWHLMQKIDWIQNYALRKCGPNCLQPCVSECVCVWMCEWVCNCVCVDV